MASIYGGIKQLLPGQLFLLPIGTVVRSQVEVTPYFAISKIMTCCQNKHDKLAEKKNFTPSKFFGNFNYPLQLQCKSDSDCFMELVLYGLPCVAKRLTLLAEQIDLDSMKFTLGELAHDFGQVTLSQLSLPHKALLKMK